MRGSFKTLSCFASGWFVLWINQDFSKTGKIQSLRSTSPGMHFCDVKYRRRKWPNDNQGLYQILKDFCRFAEWNGSHSWNRYRAKNDFRTPLPEIYKTYRHHPLETHPLDKTSADTGVTRIIRWAYLTGGAHLYKVRKAVGSRSSSIDIKNNTFGPYIPERTVKRRKESDFTDSFLLLRYL